MKAATQKGQLGGLRAQYMKPNKGQHAQYEVETEVVVQPNCESETEDGVVSFGGLPDDDESQWPDPMYDASALGLPLRVRKLALKDSRTAKDSGEPDTTGTGTSMVSLVFEVESNSKAMVMTKPLVAHEDHSKCSPGTPQIQCADSQCHHCGLKHQVPPQSPRTSSGRAAHVSKHIHSAGTAVDGDIG